MSLELKIEALTAAVIALTAKMESGTVTPAAASVAVVEPVPVVKPVVESIPVVVTPQMPAPPVFTTATVAPAMNPSVIATVTSTTANAPFTAPKGLIDFVMTSYKNLGPAKGAGIQGVLTGLGYQNINDAKAEHYAALFSGIEALKG